jgi:hypothetical protein
VVETPCEIVHKFVLYRYKDVSLDFGGGKFKSPGTDISYLSPDSMFSFLKRTYLSWGCTIRF